MVSIQNKEVRKCVNKSKSVIDYVKQVELELKRYWLEQGLDINQVNLLIQMEIDEDLESKWYISRKWNYEQCNISLEDIISDINKWESINKLRLEWIR